MSVITIGTRQIGGGNPCFIVFEAGATHTGFESAVKLARAASEAGADAVKFQMVIDPGRLVADRGASFSYGTMSGGNAVTVSEPLFDIIARRAMAPNEWRDLKAECDHMGLLMFVTVLFDEDIELAQSIGCRSLKIASADINHYPLIRKAARTGLNIQIDTGSATLGEVESAVDVIRAEGNESIIIHHVPGGYPARLPAVNLRVIETLQHMFPYPIGFSDHTPGATMDIAAVAMGASLVEKTITLDRNTRGPEHIMSLEPSAMAEFVQTIRDLGIAMGSPRRVMRPTEIAQRRNVRRSAFLKEPAHKGQRVDTLAIDWRRPGHGVGPDDDVTFHFLKSDMEAGAMLRSCDLEES